MRKIATICMMPISFFFLACGAHLEADSLPKIQEIQTIASAPAEVLEVTADTVQATIDLPGFLVLDCYAEWCPPCKRLSPIFKELSTQYGHLYRFAKLNAGDDKALAKRFKITGFPSILFFKDGKEVGRHVGLISKEKFPSLAEQFFKK